MMYVGHMDTVFPDGTAEARPFRMDKENYYGPGVGDMKNGDVAMVQIAANLPSEIKNRLNIVMVHNPDEEIGSRYSAQFYLPYAKKSDLAFVYEARSSKGGVCIQRKGAIQYKLEFVGIPGHCGFVFKNGAKSAISEMARWIVAMDALQSEELDTSVNVGVVSGGTKPNVVPENAAMTVDIRFSKPSEADRIEEAVAALFRQAEENGIKVHIVENRSKLPLVPDEKAKAYLDHMMELCQKNNVPLLYEARGGLSDANLIAQCGCICIDGMGPAGADGHCSKERMFLDTIDPSFALSSLMLKDLADRK